MKFPKLLVIGALSALAVAATAGAQYSIQTDAGVAFSDHLNLPRGNAQLLCDLMEYENHAMMNAWIRNAGPSGFALWVQEGTYRVAFDPSEAVLVGFAPTSADGEGSLSFACRLPDLMLETHEVTYFAVYRDTEGILRVARGAPFVMGATEACIIDFNTSPFGRAIPAGREIHRQWGHWGLEINATNNTPGHPDKAIVYDSSDPFGADPDLTTPGTGFLNDRAYGNVLIIAENDVDANGDNLIDVPDDEAQGGVISFTFWKPVHIYKVVLVDMDMHETARLMCYDGDRLMADMNVQPMGNNSIERIGLGADQLTRFEVEMDGSGAIAELWVIGMDYCGWKSFMRRDKLPDGQLGETDLLP